MNDNATIDEFATVPSELRAFKHMVCHWLPLERKIMTGARYREAFTKPKIDLNTAWPQFASWLITDEQYGVFEFLPQEPRLISAVKAIIAAFDQLGRGQEVSDNLFAAFMDILASHADLAERSGEAAACAWQTVFNLAYGDINAALRYSIMAHTLARGVAQPIMIRACVNTYNRKMLELLKVW